MSERGLYGQKPSKSADEARRAEFARVWAMTPLERALLALRLGQDLKETVRRSKKHEPDDA